jgi:hypothetical protein
MSKTLLNFWLDAAMLVTVVVAGWVSAMMQVVFPAPTSASGWTLWGLSYNQWRDVQFYSLCVFGVLALEHLVLHWTWICSVLATQVLRLKNRPDEGNQALYGVAAFITVVTVSMAAILAALVSIRHPLP